MLDEIVCTLISWIEIVKYDKIKNSEIANEGFDYGDKNILIISSIMCLLQIEDMVSRDYKMPIDRKDII